MTNKLYFLLLAFFFVFVIFVIWLVCDNPNTGKREYPVHKQSIIISSEPIRNSPSIKNASEEVLAPTLTPYTAVPVTEVTKSQPAETAQENLTIYIKDYFEELIGSGVLIIDNQEKSFTQGKAVLFPKPNHPVTVTARAQGYKEESFSFDPSSLHEYTAHVEYVTDFQIKVFSSETIKNPVDNAEVTLYEGFYPPRPIQLSNQFSVRGHDNTAAVGIKTSLSDRNAYIQDLIYYDNRTKKTPAPLMKEIKLELGMLPSIGNKIVGLSGCLWNGENYANSTLGNAPSIKRDFYKAQHLSSSSLRIWDVLSSLPTMEELSDKNTPFNYLEYVADSNKFSYTRLIIPNPGSELKKIKTQQTDSNGYCIFKNVPPGVYFVQSHKDSSYSFVEPIHSTQTNIELPMDKKCRLGILVKRIGIDVSNVFMRSISDITIKLQSLGDENKGFYIKKTDQYGKTVFDDLPMGNYTINVESPEDTPQPPISRTLTINQPNMYQMFEFNDGYKIAGKVVIKDSSEPVPDFPVELYLNIDGTAIPQKTDANGDFTFLNIVPGLYMLNYPCQFDNKDNYFPVDYFTDGEKKGIYFYDKKFPLQKIVLEKDVTDITISVVPCTKTVFNGTVVNTDKSPISGAHLKMTGRLFSEEDPITDSRGNFHVTLPSAKSDNVQREQLLAFIANKIPVRAIPLDKDGFSCRIEEEHFDVLFQGETEIQFKPGDIINNIKIVIDQRSLREIEGTVHTEDGKWPIQCEITASQSSLEKKTAPDETGKFKITGISPGDIDLHICSDSTWFTTKLFGQELLYMYIPEHFNFTFPNEQNKQYVDITLKKASFISGYVVDQNQKPIPNIGISTGYTTNVVKKSLTLTDENGIFMLYNLPMDCIYSIRVLDRNFKVQYTKIDNVPPGKEDVVIVLDANQLPKKSD